MIKVWYTNKNDKMKSKVVTNMSQVDKILRFDNCSNTLQHWTDLNDVKISFKEVDETFAQIEQGVL